MINRLKEITNPNHRSRYDTKVEVMTEKNV